MDAAKWSQGFQDISSLVNKPPMEEIVSNTCNRPTTLERKTRPPEQLNCPRCNSTNTKFCYYNNYSLTQPRYFCKTCRRYWTEGGSLRNVPVGGGSRKNKRSSSSSSAKVPDLNPASLSQFSSQNPKTHKGQDLNLAFPAIQEGHNISQYLQVPKIESNNQPNSSSSFSSSPLSALELLRTGIASTGLNSFIPEPMPDSNALYSTGFSLQDYKPTLTFSLDGLGNRTVIHEVQENGGRLFFPFGEMKQLSSASDGDQNKGSQGNSTAAGYWNNGVLGGGSW